MVAEWDILVVGRDVATGFVARDLDPERSMSRAPDRAFAWCLVDDRDLLLRAAGTLLTRAPRAYRCHETLQRLLDEADGAASSSLGA